jgi:ABC-type branched-subunit amino acid transport system ATPase component
MSAILNVHRLSKHFSGVRALEGVDIDVLEGEVLGLVGPNGSGKTTLFNCITGFVRPSGGRTVWEGRDVTNLAPDQIARLGIVRTFQQKMVFPQVSVRENLEMAWQRSRNGERAKRFGSCADLLRFLGLEQMDDTAAADIPFGSARSLGLGLALAANPRLLLLDEPAAGLNQEETRELGELVQRIRGLGITVCVIEHDMPFIMSNCQRVIVLHAGQKIAEGAPADVAHHPEVVTVFLGEKFAHHSGAQ